MHAYLQSGKEPDLPANPYTQQMLKYISAIVQEGQDPENTFLVGDFMIRHQFVEVAVVLDEIAVKAQVTTLILCCTSTQKTSMGHAQRTTGELPYTYPAVQDQVAKFHPLRSIH